MPDERHGGWPGPATGHDSDLRRASLAGPLQWRSRGPPPSPSPISKGHRPHAAPAPSSGRPYIPHLPHTWPPPQLPSRTAARGSPAVVCPLPMCPSLTSEPKDGCTPTTPWPALSTPHVGTPQPPLWPMWGGAVPGMGRLPDPQQREPPRWASVRGPSAPGPPEPETVLPFGKCVSQGPGAMGTQWGHCVGEGALIQQGAPASARPRMLGTGSDLGGA